MASNTEWEIVKKSYGNKCLLCKKPESAVGILQRSHIRAKSRGGTLLRPLCPNCHHRHDDGQLNPAEQKALGYETPAIYKRMRPKENTSPKTQLKEESVVTKGKPVSQRELVIKAQKQVRKLGYDLSPNKFGFDVCGIIDPPIGVRKYLVVGCNPNEMVSENYVRPFLKKIQSFAKRQSALVDVRGMIAYTGKFSEGAKALLTGQKPPIQRWKAS